jgi:hypothetical protein
VQRNYIVIIWPTGYDYRNEIYEYYNSHRGITNISKVITKRFENKADFMSFINDVYKNDDLPKEILVHKTKIMIQLEPLSCGVFKFSCNSSVIESQTDQAVLDIKTNIRRLIALKMENYYYDILLHVTDTKYEYNSLKSVFLQHGIMI